VSAAASMPAGAPAAAARVVRRPLHGVLLLDKPLGLSSNAALQQARRLLRAEKAGHTGTLDPLASGLLPLCFGAATKFSQAHLDADKAYRATLRLGERSSTGDAEGEITPGTAPAFDRAALEAACAALTGAIEQLPPMHSALKKDGRPLYDYARTGQTVDRAPRRVTVHRLDIVEWQDRQLVIDVVCGKGTYIRTLAADLGDRLGCGAWLAALRRTASGPFRVGDAVTLDALAALDEAAREAWLLPPDALLAGTPVVRLPADEAGRFLAGLRRRVALADASQVRVYGPPPEAAAAADGADPAAAPGIATPPASAPAVFLGSAHITAGELIADRLLSPLEVNAQRSALPA
jgi:tRNA pseudouridine55 synthase